MTAEIRKGIRNLCSKYDTWVRAMGKFLLALTCFLTIRFSMGQMETLNSVILLLILALAASFLPMNLIVFFGSLLILGHLYALSLPAFVVGTGVLLILLLLYFGLAPGQALPLILMPLALALKIPLLVPLSFGLLSTPLSGFGMAVGAMGYYSIRSVLEMEAIHQSVSVKEVLSAEVLLQNTQDLIASLLGNSEMFLTLIAVIAVLIAVFAVRNTEIRYAWQMAVGTGTLIYLIVELIGMLLLAPEFSLVVFIIGTVVSVLAASLLRLYFFDLDYKRTEKMQFEDDDYYYYVTAIPKRKQERTVDEWTQ